MDNPFETGATARRYAGGRPHHHERIASALRDRLARVEPVPQAVDVGCGTGLSTVALKPAALRVLGIDRSREMIAEAPQSEGIFYVVAPAEALPLASGSVGLLAACSAFHWFDRSRFLSEARRVLEPGGLFVICEHGFTGQMREDNRLRDWVDDAYLKRFPTPPRNPKFMEAEGDSRGFDLLFDDRYENAFAMTLDALAGYLTTQSNIIVAIERGGERIEEIRRWLGEQLHPFFTDPSSDSGEPERHLLFTGRILCLSNRDE